MTGLVGVREQERRAARALAVGTRTQPAAPTLQSRALALQRRVGNRATGMLLRQETATAAPSAKPKAPQPRTWTVKPRRIVVEMDDGSRYVVTRTESTKPEVIPKGKPKLGVGSDADRVWLRVYWCRGTRGEVRIGGNPQGAAKDLLKTIAQEIANGGGPDDVAGAVRDAEIEPFAEIDLERAGDWKLSGGVKITVNRSGVTKGSGSIGVQKGPVSVEAEGSVEQGRRPGEDPQWSITVKGTWKGTPPKTKEKCEEDQIVFPWEYSVVRERDVPAHTEQHWREDKREESDSRYVYFVYERSVIEEKLSAGELAALKAQLEAGWKVVGAKGFTSPEGSRPDPTPLSMRTPRFRGNDQLARDRADAALKRARELLPEGVPGVPATSGQSELYPLFEQRDGREVEIEGTKLEKNAVEHFLTDEREERHRTPELVKRINAARSPRRKAQLVYPFMRRAELELKKTTVERRLETVHHEASVERTKGGPKSILELAKEQWRLQDALKTSP